MKDKDFPPGMTDGLDMIPDDVNAVLLIRHSLRYPIPPGDYGNHIPLTSEGVLLAEEWGRHINRPVGKVFSSKVDRCVRTGEAILRGANQDTQIVHIEPALYEAFICDWRTAGQFFIEYGPIWALNRLLENIPVPGMFTLSQGARRIMTFMLETLSDMPDMPCLNIFITHDSLLAPVICYLLGINKVDEENWPRMLEGAFFWYEESELFWAWRGTKRKILY